MGRVCCMHLKNEENLKGKPRRRCEYVTVDVQQAGCEAIDRMVMNFRISYKADKFIG